MKIGSSRQDDFEINVISLIDVMLTLLMFFVMTTTFVSASNWMSRVPRSGAGVQAIPRVRALARFGGAFLVAISAAMTVLSIG